MVKIMNDQWFQQKGGLEKNIYLQNVEWKPKLSILKIFSEK